MQKSTHQVQYVNLPTQEFELMTDKLKEKLKEDPFDNIK